MLIPVYTLRSLSYKKNCSRRRELISNHYNSNTAITAVNYGRAIPNPPFPVLESAAAGVLDNCADVFTAASRTIPCAMGL